MKKKVIKAKEPVRIRFKKLANGNQSIYLDIYKDGERQYEFLKLYLVPDKTPSAKMQNEETLRVANAIKAQRIVAMQNEQHGFSNAGTKGRVLFVDYLRKLADRYEAQGSRKHAYSLRCAVMHIIKYKGDKTTMKGVDKNYLLGYIDYLNGEASARFKIVDGKKVYQKLSDASKHLYYNVVVIALNRAVEEDVIAENPANRIVTQDKPKPPQSTRVYLTIDEVKRLAATPCRREEVKLAFLFCCFCGLRYGDVKNLTWSAIKDTSDGHRQVEIIQQKTGAPVFVPLSENALQWLPERGDAGIDESVFGLTAPNTVMKCMRKWAKDAGVTKHVSFHVSRHTFATLTLTYGADLYTVSKLMGHSKIQTTQIYAKIVDESKRKAVELIPKLSL